MEKIDALTTTKIPGYKKYTKNILFSFLKNLKGIHCLVIFKLDFVCWKTPTYRVSKLNVDDEKEEGIDL